jgi:hypothetical protein
MVKWGGGGGANYRILVLKFSTQKTEKWEDILARLREAGSVDRRHFELVEVRATIAELRDQILTM